MRVSLSALVAALGHGMTLLLKQMATTRVTAMDKDFWQSFMRFLDEASMAELQERLVNTRTALDSGLRNPDVKSDAKRIIRFLEQEIMARSSTGT